MEIIFQKILNNCYLLKDINALENWNVSNGKDFSEIFYKCESLNDKRSTKLECIKWE